MKLAFVAKGGSGKSTVTSLFVRFLEESAKKYLCVDADINMHMMDILGINLAREKGLSFGSNKLMLFVVVCMFTLLEKILIGLFVR